MLLIIISARMATSNFHLSFTNLTTTIFFFFYFNRIAATITIVDTITSLTSGIIVFGILGNLAYETNTTDISTVVKGGIGLAFISYPDAIAKFEFVPQVFSATFFLMLFVIGVGCVVGLQICLMTSIQDLFHIKSQLKLILCLASGEFLIGLLYITSVRQSTITQFAIKYLFFLQAGQYLVTLVDYFCVSFLIYIMAIAELIAFGWIYGIKRLCCDIEFMLGTKTNVYWRISWGVIAPVLMIGIFLNELITMTSLQYRETFYPDEYYGKK